MWIVFVVFCPLGLSESGDGDWPEKEVTCTSTLTLIQNNLTCFLNDEPIEEVIFATICKMKEKRKCTNATLGPKYFSFESLENLVKYELQVHTRDDIIEKEIDLTKMVKIPAPELKSATFLEDTDEIFIWFEHSHVYVRECQFQVEIRGEHEPISLLVDYKNISMSRDRLGGDGVYSTRVRAKPINYFAGDWSEWSSDANFTIKTKNHSLVQTPQVVTGIITIILVLIISLIALRWRTQIKNYITPNIPHPKETLAQMQRAKEGLPFTFSPEIFSDTFIHRVDYVDEKPSASELQDGLNELRYSYSSASVSEMDMNADERLPREQSHLKIRLLDESDLAKEMENTVSQGLKCPQLECKDEAYVTMSSLFKTK